MNEYVVALVMKPDGSHGHYGIGSTAEEAEEALRKACECYHAGDVEYWRAWAPEGKKPRVTELGGIYSWAEPELLEGEKA